MGAAVPCPRGTRKTTQIAAKAAASQSAQRAHSAARRAGAGTSSRTGASASVRENRHFGAPGGETPSMAAARRGLQVPSRREHLPTAPPDEHRTQRFGELSLIFDDQD